MARLPLAPMIDGLKVTFENFFREPTTVQYPEERRETASRERGFPVLRSFPDTGECRCVACGLCEVVCPGHCLEVHAQSEGGDRRVRILEEYILDASHCLVCGYCAAACPVEAVVMSDIQDVAGFSRRNMLFNLEELMELGRRFEPRYQATKGAAEYRLPDPDRAAGRALEHKDSQPVEDVPPVSVPVRGKAAE
ncbi:MAG: NADH-quinone oxidoreductase subunit I [Chloroflexi bacterium]|nr:NADH-quinone oxidoreductase subunit I [Chloroflexota bacterium]